MVEDRNPLRILQIGLGNRGRMWAEIIARREDVTLAGVVDVDVQRIAALRASASGAEEG